MRASWPSAAGRANDRHRPAPCPPRLLGSRRSRPSRALRVVAPPAVAAGLLFAASGCRDQEWSRHARLLPAPGKVWDTLVRSLGVLLEQAQPTFWGAVAGILLAAALGIPPGAAVSYSRTPLMQTVYPTIVFSSSFPGWGPGPGVPAVVRHRLRGQRDLLGLHRLLPRRGGDDRRPAGRAAGLRAALPQPDDAALAHVSDGQAAPRAAAHLCRPAHRRDLRRDRRRAGRVHHRPDGVGLHHPVLGQQLRDRAAARRHPAAVRRRHRAVRASSWRSEAIVTRLYDSR